MEKSNKQQNDLTKCSIRLFGKEFGGSDPTIIIIDDSSSTAATTTITSIHHETKTKSTKKPSQRNFKCHYCNRNFLTSQALGGHQNAHRSERLLAKRTHIQSVPYYNNHRLIVTTSPTYHHHTTNKIINYNNNIVKLYGDKAASTSNQTPIYGRPLVPKLTTFNCSGLWNFSSTGSSSRSLYMHEPIKPRVNDQVSLDLHL